MPMWTTCVDDTMTQEVLSALLDMELQVNDAMYALALAVKANKNKKESAVSAGKCIFFAAEVAQRARVALDGLGCLKGLALHKSMAILLGWCENAASVARSMQDGSLDEASDMIMTAAQAVDGVCPRWGDYINDQVIQADMAKLQLIDNKAISTTLPTALKTLNEQMSQAQRLTTVLHLPAADSCKRTHEAFRVGQNSTEFGRRTVQVAAGLKVFLMDPEKAKDVLDKVLALEKSLPAALLRGVQAMKAGKPLPPMGTAGGVKRLKSQALGQGAKSANSVGSGSAASRAAKKPRGRGDD